MPMHVLLCEEQRATPGLQEPAEHGGGRSLLPAPCSQALEGPAAQGEGPGHQGTNFGLSCGFPFLELSAESICGRSLCWTSQLFPKPGPSAGSAHFRAGVYLTIAQATGIHCTHHKGHAATSRPEGHRADSGGRHGPPSVPSEELAVGHELFVLAGA